jgi:hypothetical protein
LKTPLFPDSPQAGCIQAACRKTARVGGLLNFEPQTGGIPVAPALSLHRADIDQFGVEQPDTMTAGEDEFCVPSEVEIRPPGYEAALHV